MRTPENIDSSTPQEFGNSWTAAEVWQTEKAYLQYTIHTHLFNFSVGEHTVLHVTCSVWQCVCVGMSFQCVNSPDIRHPCNLNPLREPFAKRQCGILLSEVFQVCHPVVSDSNTSLVLLPAGLEGIVHLTIKILIIYSPSGCSKPV